MTPVQVVGHIAEFARTFLGLNREVTADTDNHDLILHDGVTPGGHRIPNQMNNDVRYQTRSEELDGLVFAPELRGLLTRVGPGSYRLRAITVNPLQLVVTEGKGTAGDIVLGLNPIIGTELTFAADILMEGVLQVDGGINANISGDVTGNLTGDVEGNVVGNLTGNANGNHTGTFAGDVDVRGKLLQLDNNQIPTSAINGLSAFVSANGLPSGIITMWSGTEVDIPAGWFLCDGTNGTPDLIDRFIVAGGDVIRPAHDIGGTINHTHVLTVDNGGAHTHPITVDGHVLTVAEMPAHNHANGVCDNSTVAYNHGTILAVPTTSSAMETNSATGTNEGLTTDTGSGDPHDHTASSASAGIHNHAATAADAVTVPPFYALCFIMKG